MDIFKKSTIALVLIPLFFFTFCTKTDPDEFKSILGQWDEKSSLMDQESLVFTDIDTVIYYTRTPLKYVSIEPFVYSLNSTHTKLYLKSVDNPEYKIICEIVMNSKATEFSIVGLVKDHPELSQKFIKNEK